MFGFKVLAIQTEPLKLQFAKRLYRSFRLIVAFLSLAIQSTQLKIDYLFLWYCLSHFKYASCFHKTRNANECLLE